MRTKPELSPRQEYQLQENRRAEASPTVADIFPSLKTLEVNLDYFDADRPDRTGQIKYQFNLVHARSVFRIDCQNPECVGGDFDLTHLLSDAVMERRTDVTGELACQGWKTRTMIGKMHCGKSIRYHLKLSY